MIVTDILFKAKCKDKDTWVEGFYFNMPDKTRHYEESWRKDIIPVGSYIASPSPDGLEMHEVDPITVGQITGKNELKKNGSGYSDPTAYKAIMNVGGGNSNECISWRHFLHSE